MTNIHNIGKSKDNYYPGDGDEASIRDFIKAEKERKRRLNERARSHDQRDPEMSVPLPSSTESSESDPEGPFREG